MAEGSFWPVLNVSNLTIFFMPDSQGSKKGLFQQSAVGSVYEHPWLRSTIVRSSDIKPRKKILAAINIQKAGTKRNTPG